jgi:hypothetical protein
MNIFIIIIIRYICTYCAGCGSNMCFVNLTFGILCFEGSI